MSEQRESQRFHKDTVVVTGSTRGIGAEIARQFADEGAAVVITGRSTADGEAVVNSIKEPGGMQYSFGQICSHRMILQPFSKR